MPDEEKKKEQNTIADYYDAILEREAKASQLTADVEIESSFTITKEEQKRIAAWFKEQDAKVVQMQQQSGRYKDNPYVQALHRQVKGYYGASGGALTYHFTPTGLGTIFKISHALTGETLDLTDYDNS